MRPTPIHASQDLSPAQRRITEAETQPLPALRGLAFRFFLERHRLSLLDVAEAAGVLLLTVWNVAHDYPVSRQHAEMMRAGLFRLTGVRYRGGMKLHPDQASPCARSAFLYRGYRPYGR